MQTLQQVAQAWQLDLQPLGPSCPQPAALCLSLSRLGILSCTLSRLGHCGPLRLLMLYRDGVQLHLGRVGQVVGPAWGTLWGEV